jgi:hypothetical protein
MSKKVLMEPEWVTHFFGQDTHPSKQEEGGPGSGNFQHAGRPGEVGGSSGPVGDHPNEPSYTDMTVVDLSLSTTKGSDTNPVKPNEFDIYFHGTSSACLKAIAKNGLVPGVMLHNQLYGSQYYSGERKDSVFVAEDKYEAGFWGLTAVRGFPSSGGVQRPASVIVFEVRVPHEKLQQDEIAGSGQYYYKGKIPPENIKGFWVLPLTKEWTGSEWKNATHGKLHELRKGETFYVPIVVFEPTKEKTGREEIDAWWEKTLTNMEAIPKLLKKYESLLSPLVRHALREMLEGGVGSGNFDHPGRPGEVGGSGEGGQGGIPDIATTVPGTVLIPPTASRHIRTPDERIRVFGRKETEKEDPKRKPYFVTTHGILHLLPEKDVKTVSSFNVLSKGAFGASYDPDHPEEGEKWAGFYRAWNRSVCVKETDPPAGVNFTRTTIHEIGHSVAYKMFGSTLTKGVYDNFKNLDLARRFETLFNSGQHFPTQYSKTDVGEFFAECYEEYHVGKSSIGTSYNSSSVEKLFDDFYKKRGIRVTGEKW